MNQAGNAERDTVSQETEAAPRPWTPDEKLPDGSTRVTVKRCCNGCGKRLGDVSDDEIDAAIAGGRLPDVRAECGCSPVSL